MESRPLAALVFSLLLVPATAADVAEPSQPDTAPTTLYFHLLGVEDFRINTQAPPEDWSAQSLYGAGTSTATCAAQLAGNTGGVSNEYHTYYGVPLPALVDYGTLDSGVPRVVPQRGVAANVSLDDGAPARLVWYVSVQTTAGDALSSLPTPVPNVVLRATVRSGDAISVDDIAYNDGGVVLLGQSAPATLVGPSALGPDGQPAAGVKALGQVGGHWLYEFDLRMDPQAATIAAAAGFNVRMDLFVDNPLCADPQGSGYTMPNLVGMATLPGHRPRLELGVRQPLDGFMRTEMQGGHLILLASVGSVWGAYDIDAGAATLEVQGPGDAGFLPIEVQEVGTSHTLEARRVLAWLWPQGSQGTPGHYVATLRVPDLQGAATVVATTEFDLAPDGEASAPSLPLLALALGALALVRRRA